MEPNQGEQCLITLKEHLAELLDNISDIGNLINKKSYSLLQDLSNVDHADINGLEKIGVKMMKMLNTLNINVMDIANLLETDLNEVNKNHTQKLFLELCSKMSEYKKSFLVDPASNTNVTLKPSMFFDKDTQTDYHNDVPTVCDIPPVLENSEIKSEEKTNMITDIPYEIGIPPTTQDLELTKTMNLGLIRTDTQDTDDCWVDSVNRNTTALELWQRKYEGKKIDVTDEYLDQLKEEQAEDNEWDRKTEDLNYDLDRGLSSGDDVFVDGKSPKPEDLSGEQTIVNETEEMPEETTFNNEVEMKESNINNEFNNKNEFDVSHALETIKERLVPKEINDLDKHISNNSKTTAHADIEKSTVKDTEQTETNKSDEGSLSSLDENEASALLTLVDHLETIISVESVDKKKTEPHNVNKLNETTNHQNQTLVSDDQERETKETPGPKKEVPLNSISNSLNENISPTSDASRNNLDTVTSVTLESTNLEFHEIHKLAEDLDQNNESNVNKIPSEITYSQETIFEEFTENRNMPENDKDLDEDLNKLLTMKQSQTDHSEWIDTVKHLSYEKDKADDSDKTDTDEDINKLPVSELLAQIVDHSKNINNSEYLFSEKNSSLNADKTDDGDNEGVNKLSRPELQQQIVDNAEHVDKIEQKNMSDSDDTEIDDNVNKMSTSEILSQIDEHSKNDKDMGHLSYEKNCTLDSDETDIEDNEGVNKLSNSRPQPHIVDDEEHIDKIVQKNVSDGNDTEIDEGMNKMSTSEISEIEDHPKNNKDAGHISGEKNRSLDADKTDIEPNECVKKLSNSELQPQIIDDAEHVDIMGQKNVSDVNDTEIDENVDKMLTLSQIEDHPQNNKNIGHVLCEKNSPLDADKTYIEDNEGVNELSNSELQPHIVDDAEHDEIGQKNVSDGNDTEVDRDVNKISTSEVLSQIVDPPKNNKDTEHLSCEKNGTLDSDETDIEDDEVVNKLSKSEQEMLSHAEHIDKMEKSNVPDSDETDYDEDANKLPKSELLNSTKSPTDCEENILVQNNTGSNINKCNEENVEQLSENSNIDSDQILDYSENEHLSGTENKSDNEINVNEDPNLNSPTTKNIEEYIEGDIEEIKKSNIEEENESQSEKSFVFDVSENLKHTGQAAEENKSSVKLEENYNSQSRGATEETIEISDSDDDDVHLDVTMEEIICTGSSDIIENVIEQEDIKKEDIIEEVIDESELTTVKEEMDTEEDNKRTSQQIIGDELLELLREVEVPSDTPLSEHNRNILKTNTKKDIKEADEIFNMLQEESESDLSESEISDDNISFSCSDSELLENIYKDKHLVDTTDKKPVQNNIEKLLEEFNIKDCYVSFEKLQLDANEVVKVKDNLDDSIDRLCDLSNIIGKRKLGDMPKTSNLKKFKKPLVSNKGTSASDSLSDYSHSDSDNALHDKPSFSTDFSPYIDQKLDDLLANEICKVLKNNSSNESTDVDSDDSNKPSIKENNGDKGKTVSDVKKKHLLSKEERIKKAWKNDPLLRGKLTSEESSSSSSSDSEKSSRRRKVLRSRYEHDTDFNLTTEGMDSDSDTHTNNLNKVRLEDKIISPIKRNIPISDSSSDTDSDIEIIPSKQVTPEKDSENETLPNSSQKGRRNIRALMSDESLAEATQRANKDEQERIERLEDRHRIKESFSQSFSQLTEEDMLALDVDEFTGEPLIKVHPKLTQLLKPHQKSGVQFMWDSCYESIERFKVDEGSGCILAHCMGLGKTLQVITLLHTLFSYEETNTRHVLVVCPASTVTNWKKEVKIAFRHFSEDKLNIITIVDKKEVSQKYDIVKKWYLRKKSVLVLGYECFETLTNETKLEKISHHLKERMIEALIDPGPDLVICDEGHLLRNKKALKTLALNKIKTKRRIVLTGTPLQNNLLEYYYMVNFVKPNLLGNLKEYKTNFVNPITNGQYEDSTAEDIKLMMKRTHVLHKLLKKTIQRVEDTELKIYLPKMVDHALFIQLHQVQVDLYNKFSQLVEKNSSRTNRKGFLSDFAIFQYICTHPHLLAVMENLRNKKIKERDLITDEQEDSLMCNIEGWWKAIAPPDAAERIEYGNKLMVLKSIIEECEEIGDKVLVFSQSLGELNLIEHFLEKGGTSKCSSWKKGNDYCRMDGTVPPAHRSTICDLFNDKDNKKLRLLLMSTRVGGLGLNLTAANRVIIMTVNWNPSYDIQSVFRVYRFGQEKEVYVYRLIALDSMEEKVYQRTVTKLAIAHRVVDKHQITRHYKSMDLQELYSCKPNADTERPICNVPEDKVLAKLILKLPYIFKQHEHQALLANRPEDNLNEQELNAAWDEFKRIKDAPQMPPLQQQPQSDVLLPQGTVPNGPTFSMAFNLTRPTTSINSSNKIIGAKDSGAGINQYFIPSKIQNPSTSSGIVVSSESRRLIPIHSTAKSVTEDPLYIPPSEAHKSNKTYSELLTRINQKQCAAPKLLPDTTIVLEESSDINTQKENHNHRKPTEMSKDQPIIILDDESNKVVKNSSSENNYKSRNQHDNVAGVKRKRNNMTTDNKQEYLKKMRKEFSKPYKKFPSINLDDDNVSEIPDTCSESGSLSNELITNLGRGGITIHKVIKDINLNSGIITLD